MLELLAGPFDFKDADGNVLTAGTGLETRWDDDVGLISRMRVGPTDDFYTVSQLDGLTHIRSSYSRAIPLALDLPGSRLLAHEPLFRESLYKFDKAAGAFGDVEIGPGVTNYVYYVDARLPDRFIYAWGYTPYAAVMTMPLDAPNSDSLEYQFANSAGWDGRARISATGRDHVVCITFPSGVIVFYDREAKTEVAARKYVPANYGAWYSPKFDVFVVLDADKKLRIYSSTPEPYAISDPAAGGAVLRGRVTRLVARLTGSNGEACANELIDWTLSGPGELASAQSKTDAEGYAAVDYVAPIDLTTDPTITATMRF